MTVSKTARKQAWLPSASQVLRSPIFWAITLRVVTYSLLYPMQFRGDSGDYEVIATNLANGHGFSRCPVAPFPPTAQRPPLFPFLLSGLYFLGASGLWASFLLNVVFDLFSLSVARRWAKEVGLNAAVGRAFAWFIALCPLLIAYAPYPTTENLGVLLFLTATLLAFRVAGNTKSRSRFWAVSSGIIWGLLALCRSYFLLFPAFLLLFRPSPRWHRSLIALMFAATFVFPAVWVARNYSAFGKPVFSQGSAVGWQAYQGLCFTNFDWWNPEDVRSVYTHPILSRMMGVSCTSDEALGALDRQARDSALEDCVLAEPLQTSINVAVKGIMLFINWGQFLLYTEIPAPVRWGINGLLAFYWWCAGWALYRNRRHSRDRPGVDSSLIRYAVAGLAYVVAVTIPFGVDARYLLGPFMITWATAVGAAGSVTALTLGGLRACWPFRRPSKRGSRTL